MLSTNATQQTKWDPRLAIYKLKLSQLAGYKIYNNITPIHQYVSHINTKSNKSNKYSFWNALLVSRFNTSYIKNIIQSHTGALLSGMLMRHAVINVSIFWKKIKESKGP